MENLSAQICCPFKLLEPVHKNAKFARLKRINHKNKIKRKWIKKQVYPLTAV
jgi:hypothetical protein